jgi:hypothetical protein
MTCLSPLERIPGFKAAKDCLTVMLGSNAAGDFRLTPVFVYQSENSRVLKNKAYL